MRGSDDFFHSRIDQMIDLRHPLAVLASHRPWQEIEASLAQQLAREVKKGRSIQEHGLSGSQTAIVGGGVSKAGRPRLPFRLMVSLLYLKHAFNESDEGLVERWSETPTGSMQLCVEGLAFRSRLWGRTGWPAGAWAWTCAGRRWR